MGDERVSTLLAALKLDEQPLVSQFMYVEEHNNADGSFILSTITKQQIERNQNVVLVVCHQSFGHFHSICQKLGFNLSSLKESGTLYVIDILEKIMNENFLLCQSPLKTLYNDICKQVDEWGHEKGVCIVVENLSNLLLAGVEDFLIFVCYLRTIIAERKSSSVVLSMHTFPDCPNFNIITKSIRHMADVVVVLKDLQTGRANDVTGYLIVTRREDFVKSTTQYQYHLQDKSVSVFTPGARNIF